MFEGKFIFSQLMDFVPWRRLQTCIDRYNGDHKIKSYQCSEQYRVMASAQLIYRPRSKSASDPYKPSYTL